MLDPSRGIPSCAAVSSLLLATLLGACGAPATSPPSTATAPGTARGVSSPAGEAQAGTESPPATHLIVAYPAPVVTMTGFYIAVQEGYTREEGLDAEMVLMSGTLSAQGIVARQVDFGMSAGSLLAARLRGAPIKNVFVQIDKPMYYLYTQPD